VEGENRDPSARIQRIGQLFQKRAQRVKLAVHIDPQRLKASLAGFFHFRFLFPFRQERKRLRDDFPQMCGGGDLDAFLSCGRNRAGISSAWCSSASRSASAPIEYEISAVVPRRRSLLVFRAADRADHSCLNVTPRSIVVCMERPRIAKHKNKPADSFVSTSISEKFICRMLRISSPKPSAAIVLSCAAFRSERIRGIQMPFTFEPISPFRRVSAVTERGIHPVSPARIPESP
jgi:hypothetical protein